MPGMQAQQDSAAARAAGERTPGTNSAADERAAGERTPDANGKTGCAGNERSEPSRTPDAPATPARTAAEAGWHVSRYNVSAPLPGGKRLAIANLFKGTCAEYTPIETYLMSVLDEIDEHHPIVERLAKRGVICDFDELAALDLMGRAACAASSVVALTICTTMGCNFDCPYCFEDHRSGLMSAEVQDDVVALAARMLDTSRAKELEVTWFGGEPLLAPKIVESLSERLMALAEERGATYNASIITNGYLITQQNADILERTKVTLCQVTIDGLGPTHDATRYLRGGGATFDTIVSNLRDVKLPFKVNVRHNVHEGNRAETDELKAFIEKLAEESGNELRYYPALVSGSEVADERGKLVEILCGANASEIDVLAEANRFMECRGHYCGAHSLWSIGIDDRGNLHKCWESIDKPHLSFGTVHDWNPEDPLRTASKADMLTCFMNTAGPVADPECRGCVWLPLCVGGCPYKRLFEECACISFKDTPEDYVLALHARIGEQKKTRE